MAVEPPDLSLPAAGILRAEDLLGERLAPLEDWELARTKMWGPGADATSLEDRYLALSYDVDCATFAALNVETAPLKRREAVMGTASKPPGKAMYVAPKPDWEWLQIVQRKLYARSEQDVGYVFCKLWGVGHRRPQPADGPRARRGQPRPPNGRRGRHHGGTRGEAG